ncbi:MAG: type II toxin-antitoxin system VapC family toxin [Candidatus Bathyarchaeota archaeon]
MSRKVILDSNFLLLPLNLKIDIFTEVEKLLATKVEFILVPEVLSEVEKLAGKKASISRKAKIALQLANTKCVKMDFKEKPLNVNVDDYIANLAEKYGYIVATADIRLKKKLRDKGIPVIYPRSRKHLVLEGYVD